MCPSEMPYYHNTSLGHCGLPPIIPGGSSHGAATILTAQQSPVGPDKLRGLSGYFILAVWQPAPLPNEPLIGCVNPQHF